MAYLYSESLRPESQWQGVIARNVELLRRVAPDIFIPGERYVACLDADRLGVWVAVAQTTRPKELLRAVQERAFSSFAFSGVMFDGQRYWTHFRAM